MPKLEPKAIQKELEQGQLWPVYWLYGTEGMKARELLKRIRDAALGDGGASGETPSLLGALSEERIDGAVTDPSSILESAQSLSLGGGLRFIVVKDAHALKGAEALSPLLGQKGTREELPSVCVFVAKDLDARKKFSKLLLEGAAVVPCEEIAESEREAWISYLAKRRGVEVPVEIRATLAALDPWSLDIIDQELEKLSLGGAVQELAEGGAHAHAGERFLSAFFSRRKDEALLATAVFADRLDEALPLLGLLAWNARQLALVTANSSVKLNPYVLERLKGWGRVWTVADVSRLNHELGELDFALKQTGALALGAWSGLVTRFCR
jgi:DNA polymerase-3 subunit delta